MTLDWQQHKSSATSDIKHRGNTTSRFGRQDIYKSTFGEGMRTLHEGNSSEDHAFQEIGQLSSGRKSTSALKSVATKIGGAFHTKENKARNGAEQRLYAPDDPNTTATYDANVSDTGGIQNLGMDVGMDLPPHRPKKWGRSRK